METVVNKIKSMDPISYVIYGTTLFLIFVFIIGITSNHKWQSDYKSAKASNTQDACIKKSGAISVLASKGDLIFVCNLPSGKIYQIGVAYHYTSGFNPDLE